MYFILFVIIILLPFWHFRIDGTSYFKYFMNIVRNQKKKTRYFQLHLLFYSIRKKRKIIIIKVSEKENIYIYPISEFSDKKYTE